MPFIDDMGIFLRQLRVHLFGKGFMTLAVAAAGFVATVNPAFSIVLPLVAIGGVALTAINRLYRETLYQEQMTDLYRGDLAEQFGIAPEQVTRAHLKEAAKTNDIIDQALTRQRHKTWLSIGTSVLASTVTVGLVQFFKADTLLQGAAEAVFKNGVAANLVNFIGIGTVSGISSLFLHTGLQEAISMGTPLGKAAAHDRILEMDYQLKRGQGVSAEQVYGVLVAADTTLQHVIQKQFHKPYGSMLPGEQARVIATIGVAQEMHAVAQQINEGQMRPGKLASYISGTARIDRDAVFTHSSGNFVEKLGLSQKPQQSYRAKVDAERAAAAGAGRGV